MDTRMCDAIMLVIILMFSFMLLFGILVLVLHWSDGLGHGTPRIKFRDFKTFYALNPDRWYLEDDNIKCCTNGLYDIFYFGLIDYYRYKLWKRNIEKRKINKTNMEITARMLEAVKEDIKKTEAKANRHIKDFIDITVEIAKKYDSDDFVVKDIVNDFGQSACINCPNNPKNGGNSICNCILGQQIIY